MTFDHPEGTRITFGPGDFVTIGNDRVILKIEVAMIK